MCSPLGLCHFYFWKWIDNVYTVPCGISFYIVNCFDFGVCLFKLKSFLLTSCQLPACNVLRMSSSSGQCDIPIRHSILLGWERTCACPLLIPSAIPCRSSSSAGASQWFCLGPCWSPAMNGEAVSKHRHRIWLILPLLDPFRFRKRRETHSE